MPSLKKDGVMSDYGKFHHFFLFSLNEGFLNAMDDDYIKSEM